eukprot:c17521_g1_i1.p1 GENE.c17521_g1_i1~~c17521_g1_i1.p1  ORF type:complete len:241 (+),score=73.16 c17521_g1_i1:44-766(+)
MTGMKGCAVVFACVVSVCLAATLGKEPSIDSISPTSGLANGGTEIVIKGSNLALVTHCAFGVYPDMIEVPVSYQPYDGSTISCVSPGGVMGASMLRVTEDNGDSWHPAYQQVFFTYYNIPIIEKMAPSTGPSIGATVVNLAVHGFEDSTDTARAACMFGDKIVPMKLRDCEVEKPGQSTRVCFVTCETKQECYQHDPVQKVICQEHTVPVLFSLNGKDFSGSGNKKDYSFTFQNEWAHSA